MREIEISNDTVIKVEEQWELDNDAGAVVWDAALVLSHFLIHSQGNSEHGTGLVNKRVIEIGSGTGLVGLVAAALRAKLVILTDLGHLIPYLNSNIRLNDLEKVVHAAELEWGNMAHISSVLKQLARGTSTLGGLGAKDGLQLEHPSRSNLYPDLIIGSDLIYKLTELDTLFLTLALLCGPETTVVICQEHRPGTEAFHEVAKRHGFIEHKLPSEHLHPEWRSEDINIFVLKLK